MNIQPLVVTKLLHCYIVYIFRSKPTTHHDGISFERFMRNLKRGVIVEPPFDTTNISTYQQLWDFHNDFVDYISMYVPLEAANNEEVVAAVERNTFPGPCPVTLFDSIGDGYLLNIGSPESHLEALAKIVFNFMNKKLSLLTNIIMSSSGNSLFFVWDPIRKHFVEVGIF